MANEKRITTDSNKTNRGSQTPTYTPPKMPKVQPPKTTKK